jgi:effector-binding domain-containing protein
LSAPILELCCPACPATSRFDTGHNSKIGAHVGGGRGNVDHEVTVKDVQARPTAVVAATTTWPGFPQLWRELLDEVWACLRANGVTRGCRNVMLFLDDVPNVEVGVELLQPCPLTGRVVASNLPAGQVATTVHYGPHAGLGDVYQAVHDWCTANDRQLAGPRWEVYGPHRDDPAEVWTEVYCLLS